MRRLALLSVLTACASQLHAQPAFTCSVTAGVPPLVRAEGVTELVGDIVLNCTGGVPTRAGTPVPRANITVRLNTNVTNRLARNTEVANPSDALLMIDEPGTRAGTQSITCSVDDWAANAARCIPVGTGAAGSVDQWGYLTPGGIRYGTNGIANIYQAMSAGTGAPNTLVWPGVPIDAPGTTGTRVIRISNIRANAAQLGVSSTLLPSQVVAFVSVPSTAAVALANPQQTIGLVTRGVTFSKGSAAGASLTGRFLEGFASSFKRRASQPGDVRARNDGTVGAGLLFNSPLGWTGAYDADISPTPITQAVPGQNWFTETGFHLGPGVLSSAGLSDTGTRLMVRLEQLPAGADVYAGLYEVGATHTNSRVRLVWTDAKGAGTFDPMPATTTAFSVPAAHIPISGGAATAVYEVVGTDPTIVETIEVPIFVTGATVSAIDVTGGAGPSNSLVFGSTTAPLPGFAASLSPITIPTAVGVFRAGMWALDANGSGFWDGTPRDSFFALGGAGDIPVVGDWNGDGKSEVGINHRGFWILDYNGNGRWDGPAIDRFIALGGNAGEVPVMGDWNGDGRTKVGFFWNGFWALDYNGNGQWDGTSGGDRFIGLGGVAGDVPVVGDWNGDGWTDVGIFRNGIFALDFNGNGQWDGENAGDRYFVWGQAGDTPVVGDWNGNGRATYVGVNHQGFWVLDYNGNQIWDGSGIDRFIALGGNAGEIPIVGDWNGDGRTKVGFFWKGFWALDYNGNGRWDGESAGDRFIGLGGQPGEQPVVGNW
jgi:hypothetical protein